MGDDHKTPKQWLEETSWENKESFHGARHSLRNSADTTWTITTRRGSWSIVHWHLLHWLSIKCPMLLGFTCVLGTHSHGCSRKSSDRKAESCRYLRWEVVRCRGLSAAAAAKNVFEEWNVPQHNLLYLLTMDQALLVFICIIQLNPIVSVLPWVVFFLKSETVFYLSHACTCRDWAGHRVKWRVREQLAGPWRGG